MSTLVGRETTSEADSERIGLDTLEHVKSTTWVVGGVESANLAFMHVVEELLLELAAHVPNGGIVDALYLVPIRVVGDILEQIGIEDILEEALHLA